ncbi:MAG: hypothetical protein ABSA39_15830 [Edaphobacter sp.]
MSFLPASRTRRRLLKVASLGLAGLIAGLLSGCNSANASARTSRPQAASDTLNSDPSLRTSPLPLSLDATQIPALHHPPSARRLQYGSVHTVSQVVVPNSPNRS